MERYEILRDIGSGNFGVAKLVRDKWSHEHYAVKFIERGDKIDEHVQREIMNHRSLKHPNIVRFKEVLLTPTHLGIVMEYAAGGELFEIICSAGRFSEDEARFFFQQLISGVNYCHSMQICHRDLKLENTLLDGSSAPRLKICDFGYSKSSVLHSQPKSTVGTPAYIAPEVFSRKEYDGKIADVWSCGVTLYVMLVGAYPFEDADDPRNFRTTITVINFLCPLIQIPCFIYSQHLFAWSSVTDTDGMAQICWRISDTFVFAISVTLSVPVAIFALLNVYNTQYDEWQRILSVQYSIPDYVRMSMECIQLLSQIFVADPEKRITISEIEKHPWFLKNLPIELTEEGEANLQMSNDINPSQSIEEVLAIIKEASKSTTSTKGGENYVGGSIDFNDIIDDDTDLDEIETSGDFVCAL